jgi:predicted nucleic acid-binding protein
MVKMYNFQRLEGLKVFLSSLTGYKGLRIYSTDLSNEIRATKLPAENELDMDDAIQHSIALATNIEAIVSFDRHFNKLKIPRKEPHQIT